MELYAKTVGNINLKTLTILVKRFLLDAWLGPEYAPAGGYNIVLKIQTEISPWQHLNLGQLNV